MIYKEDNFLLGNFIFKSGYSFIPDGKGNYSVVNSLNENGTIRSTFQLTYDNNVNKFPAIDNNYHAIDQIDLLLYNILLFKSKNYLKEIVIPGSNTTSYETVLNESGYATQIKRNGLPFLKYTYDCK